MNSVSEVSSNDATRRSVDQCLGAFHADGTDTRRGTRRLMTPFSDEAN